MPTDGEASVTLWLIDLQRGADDATQRLWERYFEQLVRLARARLCRLPGAAADEEDVALSAFDSFFAGAARGRFPRLSDRNDLWRVLVTITARKAADLVERECRHKRGGGRVLGEAAWVVVGHEGGRDGLDWFAGREPSPEFAAMFAEEFRRRLDGLDDESLRRVALLKLEGYTHEEIADRLGCALRTVDRKLERIRVHWLAEEPS